MMGCIGVDRWLLRCPGVSLGHWKGDCTAVAMARIIEIEKLNFFTDVIITIQSDKTVKKTHKHFINRYNI